MNFPDSTPLHPFVPPSFPGGDGDRTWPFLLTDNVQPELAVQNDYPPYKRARNSEIKVPKYASSPMNQSNLNGSSGTSHIFYKTRICAKFLDGMCRNGEHCTFAHGPEELRDPPPNWQDLVREKDRGAWSNWNEDQRMNNRTKICKKFYSGEECPYGEKCIFLHERDPKVISDSSWQRESAAINLGTRRHAMWSSGDFDQPDADKQVIGNMDTSQVRTEFWKTKLCSKWEIGQCPFGERCHYAHGQSELIMHSGSNPAKANPLPSNVVADYALAEMEEDKSLKWKLSRKVNRIYADWIDDLSPPNHSPNKEDGI